MNRFTKWMEDVLAPPFQRLAGQRHMRSVRDGVVSTIPFIIVGAFFLLAAFLPIGDGDYWQKFLGPWYGWFLTAYGMTFGLAAIMATFMIGYTLAMSYKVSGPHAGMLSIMAFLLFNPATDGKIPTDFLGPQGYFVAIVSAIFATEVYRFFIQRKITINMPAGVPPAVAGSFAALFPTVVVAIVVWFIREPLGFDPNAAVSTLMKPFVMAVDSYPGVVAYMLVWNFPWLLGVHGMIIDSVADPITLGMLAQNAAAQTAGTELPHIVTKNFYTIFAMTGGSGCTLALVLMLLRAKSARMRTIGRIELPLAIFNINEPIIFGLPVVLNPIMMIPFMLAPIAVATVSYVAFWGGFVHKTFLMVPWAIPNPIASYLSTGGDWKAVIVSLVNIVVAGLVWYPFFKIYDKQLTGEEKSAADAEEEERRRLTPAPSPEPAALPA